MKVLAAMTRDPAIHEKIFRQYKRGTGVASNDNISEDALNENVNLSSPERREQQMNLIKRLIYFFGPYTEGKVKG